MFKVPATPSYSLAAIDPAVETRLAGSAHRRLARLLADLASASRFEQCQRLSHPADIMHAQNLHSLTCQGQRRADRAAQSVGLAVAQDLGDESLARRTDEHGAAKRVEAD